MHEPTADAGTPAVVETRHSLHSRCVTLRLNRPASGNALDPAAALALSDALARLQSDAATTLVIITGTGRHFTGGADIHALNALSGDALTAYMELTADILGRILLMPKIVVAAVNGATAGLGNHIAVCADLCVARRGAAFHFTGSAKAIPSMMIGAALMPLNVGIKHAKQLYLRGGRLGDARALDLGLCNEVVAEDEWDRHLDALAAEFQDKSSLTMAHNKFQTNQLAYQMLGASRLSYLAGATALSEVRTLAPGRTDTTS